MINHNIKFNNTTKSREASTSERSGTKTRLNKFLSESGVTSRRKADDFIKAGKVMINGKKANVGVVIDGSVDKVTVEGKDVNLPEKFKYYAFYKPAGYITSLSDEQGESIKKFLPKSIRLFSVGRLDKETEGLLILTNDGQFANYLSHPSCLKEKVYHLEYGGKPTNIGKEGIVRQFLKGIMYNNRRYYVDKARFVSGSKIEVTLHQGRSRQLRIMAGKIGLEVKSLKRVQVGKLKLSRLDLREGKIVEIKKEDVI